MFVPPRFVAVDDKQAHLNAILQAFQEMGAPCLGIRFLPEEPLDARAFSGVRALFLDLHLIEGGVSSDQKSHYSRIQQILEDNISPVGGPFVLVIWTQHPQSAAELTAYLDKNLDPERPHARPLAILSLPKDQFINVDTGAPKSAGELMAAVKRLLTDNPQLQALISWETDILSAAGATLSSLLTLIPAESRTTAAFPGEVDNLLSRLAKEAVGKAHVDADPRSAVMQALAPILADRAVNQGVTDEAKGLWAKAVTRHDADDLPKITSESAGQLNRMLHLSEPDTEKMSADGWGVVSQMPDDMWDGEGLKKTFGLTSTEFLQNEFKVKADDLQNCKPRLIRVGAVCDYAQDRTGPVSVLAAAEIPGVANLPKFSDAVWASPLMTRPGTGEIFRLLVHCRIGLTTLSTNAAAWKPVYRFREPLMMQLVHHAGMYAARPGMISFNPKNQ